MAVAGVSNFAKSFRGSVQHVLEAGFAEEVPSRGGNAGKDWRSSLNGDWGVSLGVDGPSSETDFAFCEAMCFFVWIV